MIRCSIWNISNAKVKQYFTRYSTLWFLVLLLVAGVDLFTSKPVINFWFYLESSLTSVVSNILFLLIIMINVFFFYKEFKSDNMLWNRFGSKKSKILCDLQSTIKISAILFLSYITLIVSGSLILCNGQFYFIEHSSYGFNLLYYIIFSIIRYFIYVQIISIITYFGIASKNVKTSFIVIVLLLSSILITPIWRTEVKGFYNFSVFMAAYLNGVFFSSYITEIICSILNIVFYVLLGLIFWHQFVEKKRDV